MIQKRNKDEHNVESEGLGIELCKNDLLGHYLLAFDDGLREKGLHFLS